MLFRSYQYALVDKDGNELIGYVIASKKGDLDGTKETLEINEEGTGNGLTPDYSIDTGDKVLDSVLTEEEYNQNKEESYSQLQDVVDSKANLDDLLNKAKEAEGTPDFDKYIDQVTDAIGSYKDSIDAVNQDIKPSDLVFN